MLERKADVLRALPLWEDEASREEYVAQIRFRLDADFDGLSHPVQHPQYFPADLFAWSDDEWVVDAGAYDGDTIKTIVRLYGDRFRRVLALEPDPANFAKLQQVVESLPQSTRGKIECRQLAVASERPAGCTSTRPAPRPAPRAIDLPSTALPCAPNRWTRCSAMRGRPS